MTVRILRTRKPEKLLRTNVFVPNGFGKEIITEVLDVMMAGRW